MRINNKESLFESFQHNLKEENKVKTKRKVIKEAFDPIQYWGSKNQYGYSVRQLKIDYNNKTYAVGSFKQSVDKKVSNKAISEKIEELKAMGFKEETEESLTESSDDAINIESYIGHFEYPPEIEPEEEFNKSSDSSYFTVVRNEREAERFNYHSDYWGSAEEYQDANVELVSSLEGSIEDGSKFYMNDDDGTHYEFTVTGIAIDKQYNSVSHTKILIKEVPAKETVNEAIEQKYEKSNPDYNSFLKDVKHYTGSYTYLFGGKVDSEYAGYPITIKYFYYERPYGITSYNLVVNVLTPMDALSGDYIQEAIEDGFEPLKNNKLSNGEIKNKITEIVSSLD